MLPIHFSLWKKIKLEKCENFIRFDRWIIPTADTFNAYEIRIVMVSYRWRVRYNFVLQALKNSRQIRRQERSRKQFYAFPTFRSARGSFSRFHLLQFYYEDEKEKLRTFLRHTIYLQTLLSTSRPEKLFSQHIGLKNIARGIFKYAYSFSIEYFTR